MVRRFDPETTAWDNTRPKLPQKTIPILSPKPYQHFEAFVLAPIYYGVWTHWVDDRTKPCIEPQSACCGCTLGIARRWKGYLAGWQPVDGYCLIELTPFAIENCPALEAKNGNLRGIRVRVSRRGRKANGPVVVAVLHQAQKDRAETLPNTFNVFEALTRIWNGERSDSRAAPAVDDKGSEPPVDDRGIPY